MRYLGYVLLIAVFATLQGCVPIIAAGMGTGALVANDRRTTGTYIEDQGIESKAETRIRQKYKDTVHVNVTSFNRHVLLTGEVPNEETKNEMTRLAEGVENTKAVNNELVVSGITSLSSRSGDALITTNVKYNYLNNKVFQSDHVKVVTENGVVFLMGLVYHKEATLAGELASTTSGVLRVVKVFEYLD